LLFIKVILKTEIIGISSTPFIIQLNGYFAIVTARVAEKRGIQNKPSRQPIPELKKILHPSGKQV